MKMLKLIGIVMLSTAVGLVAAPSRAAAGDPPANMKFVVGEWEFTEPGYEYRIKIEWDKTNNVFKGTLSKNVPAAENFGFELNEHVFTGLPMKDPVALVDVQKWRHGANGVSTKVEWKLGWIDIGRSSEQELIKTEGKYKRIK